MPVVQRRFGATPFAQPSTTTTFPVLTPQRLQQLQQPGLQPPPMKDDAGKVQYGPLGGALWGPQGPKPRDESQGNAGDCYFLSELSELAAHHPEFIQQMVRQNQDGSFGVRFMAVRQPNGQLVLPSLDGTVPQGKPEPVWVNVDRNVPMQNGKAIYSNQQNSPYIWPEIVEKACAKLYGSYEAIGEGGEMSTSIWLTTGWRSQSFNPQQMSIEQMFQLVQSALAKGGLVLAGTSQETRIGVVGDHAYSLLQAMRIMATGERIFTVKNPWGTNPRRLMLPQVAGVFQLHGIGVHRAFDEITFATP
jgi:hypothetical protein